MRPLSDLLRHSLRHFSLGNLDLGHSPPSALRGAYVLRVVRWLLGLVLLHVVYEMLVRRRKGGRLGACWLLLLAFCLEVALESYTGMVLNDLCGNRRVFKGGFVPTRVKTVVDCGCLELDCLRREYCVEVRDRRVLLDVDGRCGGRVVVQVLVLPLT